MRGLVLILVSLAAIIPAWVVPALGVLMWVWVSLGSPQTVLGGYALIIPLNFIIAIWTILIWVGSREPKIPQWDLSVTLFLAILIQYSISTLLAANREISFYYFDRFWKLAVLYYLVLCLFQNRIRIQALIWVCVMSLSVYGIRGGLFGLLTGGVYRAWGPPDSQIYDNNHLAVALCMSIPLAIYLYKTTREKWLRLFLVFSIACTTLAVAITYSRGGLLSLLTIYGFLLMQSRYRVMGGIMLAVLVVLALPLLPDQWFERMNTIFDDQAREADLSIQQRFDVWRASISVALKYPFFGGGFGALQDFNFYSFVYPETIATKGRAAHSIWFQIMGDHGYLGLALFSLLVGVTLTNLLRTMRLAKPYSDLAWARELSKSLFIAVVAYLIGGTFLSLPYYDYYYLLLAIASITSALVRKRVRFEIGQSKAGAISRPPKSWPIAKPVSGRFT